MKTLAALALAAVTIGAASPAAAHHSFAMYDMSKSQSAAGTIKEFRWGAPHSSVLVTIKGADGKIRDLSLLSGSPLAFSKQGFTPKSIKVGDKIQLTWHPNRNGSYGGVAATMRFKDGRLYTESEIAPGVPRPGQRPGAPPPGAPGAGQPGA